MDWRTVRFDWNRARAFLVTAEEGSFSAAARALDLAQPTLGRQVAALEAELGAVLFERVGAALELTPTGLALLDHVRAMGDAASRLSLAATGQAQSLEGTVSLTASEAVAAHLLPPVLDGLRRDHPGLTFEVIASSRVHDLQRREADLAIRDFRATEPDLVVKKLGEARVRLYATPAYVERTGLHTLADLPRADLFAFDRPEVVLDGLRRLGVDVARLRFPVVTASHLLQWELCKQGLGVAAMLELFGDAEPRVQRVLPDLPPHPLPLWLTAHRELKTSRRIRVVFDRVVEEVGRRIG